MSPESAPTQPRTIFQQHFVLTIAGVRQKLEVARQGLQSYMESLSPDGLLTAREELPITIKDLTSGTIEVLVANIDKLPPDSAAIFAPVEHALLGLDGCLSPSQTADY